MSNLKNKVVLITGASGGIGQELVKVFEQAQATVIQQYKTKKIKNGLACDLANEKSVEKMFKDINKKFGAIDVLVTNAGIYENHTCPLHEMELAQWNKTLSTNMTSVFLSSKYFFQNIKANHTKHPSLIIIGSTAGIFGEAGHADYAASKAGILHGFLKSLKNEIVQLAPLGRANAVAPGWTLTPMAKEFLKDKTSLKKTLQTIALKKLARPEDVAQAVLFLADQKLSGHISGETINVNGGMEGRILS